MPSLIDEDAHGTRSSNLRNLTMAPPIGDRPAPAAMSELRKATVRVASNYVRLALNIILTVILVPLLLHAVGVDGLALINLVVGIVGFALILEDIVQNSMLRDLAVTLHDADVTKFRRTLSAAMAISALAALGSSAVFGVLYFALPLLTIPQELLRAAHWLVTAKAVETAIVLLLTPQFSLYVVTERMVQYNALLVARRGTQIVAAAVVLAIAPDDPASGVTWFGFLASGLHAAIVSASVACILLIDPRSRCLVSMPCREDFSRVAQSGAWVTLYFGSQLLTLQPLGLIITNEALGLYGVLVLTVAAQLAGYVRTITHGLVSGIDVVAARLTSADNVDRTGPVRALAQHSSRVQAMLAAPAAMAMLVLAPSFLHVWIGSHLQGGAQPIDDMAMATRLLAIAFFAVAVGENWTRILYGIGQIRTYAPVLSLANALVPVVAMALLAVLSQRASLVAVPIAYMGVVVAFQLGWLPGATARTLKEQTRDILLPLARPGVVALACSPVLFVAEVWTTGPSMISIMAVLAGYATLYALATWRFALRSSERHTLLSKIGALTKPVPGGATHV